MSRGRVVVAGGTGFIGRALREALAARGYEPVVLSRSPAAGKARVVAWDGTSSGPWQAELDGAAAVVNLAGASVAEGRWTPQRKKVLVDSRLSATRALVAGISAAKERPRVLVSASAVGYYGDRGDEILEEGARPGDDFLARLCVSWEREARVAEPLGVRVVLPRIGVVLAPEGGALARMLPPFRMGLGGRLGGGRQWMPWVERGDLAALLVHLIETEVAGPVNAVSPNPVRNSEFAAALGRALRRPALLPAPAFALRLALGEMAQALLLAGQRAVPAKAQNAGFRFAHPALDEALGFLLK